MLPSLKRLTPLLKSVERDPFEEAESDPEPDTPTVPDRSFNNPAKTADTFCKHKEEDMWKRDPRQLEPNKKNPKEYGKFFLGITADAVKRTFEATIQLGRMQGSTKHWL